MEEKNKSNNIWKRPIISDRVVNYIVRQINNNALNCEYLDGFKETFHQWMEKKHPGYKRIFPQQLYKFLGYHNYYITGLNFYYNKTHADTQKTLF